MRVEQPSGKVLFREEQQFRQPWLWAIVLFSTLLPAVLMAVMLPKDPKVSTPEAIGGIALVSALSGISIILLRVAKLETVVTDEGVYYHWRPFRSSYAVMAWPEIRQLSVRRYPYPNYGYHWSLQYGQVHNVDGNRGVLFELANGKKVFLGSQKVTALQHALEQIRTVQVNTK